MRLTANIIATVRQAVGAVVTWLHEAGKQPHSEHSGPIPPAFASSKGEMGEKGWVEGGLDQGGTEGTNIRLIWGNLVEKLCDSHLRQFFKMEFLVGYSKHTDSCICIHSCRVSWPPSEVSRLYCGCRELGKNLQHT